MCFGVSVSIRLLPLVTVPSSREERSADAQASKTRPKKGQKRKDTEPKPSDIAELKNLIEDVSPCTLKRTHSPILQDSHQMPRSSSSSLSHFGRPRSFTAYAAIRTISRMKIQTPAVSFHSTTVIRLNIAFTGMRPHSGAMGNNLA